MLKIEYDLKLKIYLDQYLKNQTWQSVKSVKEVLNFHQKAL